MKLKYFVGASILIASISFGGQSENLNLSENVREIPNINLYYAMNHLTKGNNLRTISYSSEVTERSGCCSWHQGVCGCNAGSVVCCDGDYSPSCTC